MTFFGLFDRVTAAPALKTALERSNTRVREIADRVSKASLANGDGFALQATPDSTATAGANDVDVEAEMVALADEQLRYTATAKLLEKTYASLRLAIKGER
jgi:flagellar basal body rod protein FlgB